MKSIIRLCYRKIIDVNAIKPWDKLVFEDSYREYCMQVQLYQPAGKFTTYSELIARLPAAEKLQYLVSSSVIGYLKQLNGKIPDIQNALGRIFLPFDNYQFEIIESHAADKSKHVVAVSFFSDPLLWHETIQHQLLLSVPGREEHGETMTELFSIPPFVSIYSIKSISSYVNAN